MFWFPTFLAIHGMSLSLTQVSRHSLFFNVEFFAFVIHPRWQSDTCDCNNKTYNNYYFDSKIFVQPSDRKYNQ